MRNERRWGKGPCVDNNQRGRRFFFCFSTHAQIFSRFFSFVCFVVLTGSKGPAVNLWEELRVDELEDLRRRRFLSLSELRICVRDRISISDFPISFCSARCVCENTLRIPQDCVELLWSGIGWCQWNVWKLSAGEEMMMTTKNDFPGEANRNRRFAFLESVA